MSLYLLSLALPLLPLVLMGNVQAQSASAPDTLHAGVALSKLSPPVYPRSAQIARIEGDVDLTVRILIDGSVDSVMPLSGHVMLRQAAIDSAQHSRFQCIDCIEPVTTYALRYSFKISPRDPTKACDAAAEVPPPSPEVDVVRHEVTVFAWQIRTCDPVVTLVRVRSAKCLYLWRCSRRQAK
jgi:hypothetical protein